MVPLAKNKLRETLLLKRRNFQDKLVADQKISETVLEFLKDYRKIGIFVSRGEEIDTHRIIKELLNDSKEVYTSRFDKDEMKFYPILDFADLTLGPLDILWPLETIPVLKDDLEVMIIPMLAYDKFKHRLGYGKGYYDKYLSDFKGIKVGLAYSFQYVDKLPSEDHDIALDLIITD